jgi:hypothetical protein
MATGPSIRLDARPKMRFPFEAYLPLARSSGSSMPKEERP